MKKMTCPMNHFCERESFKEKRETYPKGTSGYPSRYEVWDPHCSDHPEWDDPSTTERCVYESDDKSEAEAFIRQGAQRCELRENGVCLVCDMYEKRQADLKEGKVRPFYLVASGTSRHYGGPEEGGWWYNWTEILEVRRAFTFQEGLRHARQLRDKYPQPRFGISSCANRGEPETKITLCYGENDPRWPEETKQAPRWE